MVELTSLIISMRSNSPDVRLELDAELIDASADSSRESSPLFHALNNIRARRSETVRHFEWCMAICSHASYRSIG